MVYMSINFIIFLIVLLIIYYLVPQKYRWIILLGASIGFYYYIGKQEIWLFLLATLISYLCGIMLERINKAWLKKCIFLIGTCVIIFPLFMIKEGEFLYHFISNKEINLIVPLGISFYTLQIISYLYDIYSGKFNAEHNLLRYMLFVFYFPQIVQGPIPRYEKINSQLQRGGIFNENMFTKGFISIVWGWFLKLMIADKAGIVVDTVFGDSEMYRGTYVMVAGVLYSIQLYADFQSCTCIARGVSELFGIELGKNFNHPYFSRNIAEFWRRWHISLSSWLRDYIYIPLGGNRKGNIRKYSNLMIVFIVSGIWHGAGYKFIVWGVMHGIYQVVGAVTKSFRKEIWHRMKIADDSPFLIFWQRAFTFICVMFAWIIFRAESLKEGLSMLQSVFTVYNPWILFNDDIFQLGLQWKEMLVLVISIFVLLKVSLIEEYGSVRERILNYNIVLRWGIYIILIISIVVFGTYGFGFDAKDFIYGGF